MNPFLWSGPAFLLFYVFFGLALIFFLYRSLKEDDASKDEYIDLTQMANDPYRIAYLRDGADEAIKVATISLVDRGLLKHAVCELKIRNQDVLKSVQRPIEKEVLRQYLSKRNVDSATSNGLRSACDGYHDELTRMGLLLTPQQKAGIWTKALVICGCLIVVSVIKLDIALAQGKHNVLFLILLTLGFIALTIWPTTFATHRSGAGNRLLADLRAFFTRLSVNANTLNPGGETNEATLLAAVYGVHYLPQEKFPFVYELYPPPTSNDSGGGDSSSGGDSGGGCGSSCGGGCGGCGGGD